MNQALAQGKKKTIIPINWRCGNNFLISYQESGWKQGLVDTMTLPGLAYELFTDRCAVAALRSRNV